MYHAATSIPTEARICGKGYSGVLYGLTSSGFLARRIITEMFTRM